MTSNESEADVPEPGQSNVFAVSDILDVTSINSGQTLSIELATTSGETIFVLLPANLSVDLAAQVAVAEQRARTERDRRA